MSDIFLDRRERLRSEGRVELPLNIDTKRYLIGNISYQDLFIISPFMLMTLISIFIIHKMGALSQLTVVLSLAPTAFMTMLQIIKHPIRKNISFLNFRIIWLLRYRKRTKQFKYQKGEIKMENSEDVRKKLGIKNVFSGAYETTDNHFVKVLEVSSLNLSLMNDTEKQNIFNGYRNFLNELNIKSIQISQIAQPINLSQYLLYIDRQTEDEENIGKRLLKQSYKKYVENIQKSRNMVQRKRYIVLREPIGSDRENSLQNIERAMLIMQTQVENMLSGGSKLTTDILQNDDLIKLIYTCLDYDNAQAQGESIVDRADNNINVSMGERTAKEVIAMFEKKLNQTIN